MKELGIKTLEDFHAAVYSCRDHHVLYRGEDQLYAELLPKLTRFRKQNPKNLAVPEHFALAEFKRRAAPHLEHIPSNDCEWLSVAQHFGLVTRLLDWSENPLVAAHFALHEPDPPRDRAIYAFRLRSPVWADTLTSPFDITEVVIYRPQHIAARIMAQSGILTAHPYIPLGIPDYDLEKWVVDQNVVWDLLVMIRMYGINYSSVMADLSGVARHVNTMYVLGMLYQ